MQDFLNNLHLCDNNCILSLVNNLPLNSIRYFKDSLISLANLVRASIIFGSRSLPNSLKTCSKRWSNLATLFDSNSTSLTSFFRYDIGCGLLHDWCQVVFDVSLHLFFCDAKGRRNSLS